MKKLAMLREALCFLSLASLTISRQANSPMRPPPLLNDTTIIFDETCANGQVRYWPPAGESRCCSQCPPGQGMVQLCTNTTDTQCGKCTEGKEYSGVFSDRDKCVPCTRCLNLHIKAKVRQNCTAKNDTVCECIPGFYFNPAGPDYCLPCTKCGPGFGAVRTCSWKTNTRCERCPRGYFSNVHAAMKPCQRCTPCAPGEKEVRPCRPEGDRVCCAKPPCRMDKKEEVKAEAKEEVGSKRNSEDWRNIVIYQVAQKNGSMPNPNGTNIGRATAPPDVSKPRGPTQTDLIPLYCCLMSLVIITLFGYVAYKYWRRRCRTGSGAKALPGGLLASTGVFPGSNKRKPTDCSVEDPEGSGMRLMALNPKYSASNQDSRRAELSGPRLANVEEQLPSDCWRDLAHALEFTTDDVMRLEAQAVSLSQPPLRVLLRDFSSRPSSTADQLAIALQNIGHHAPASFLLNDVIDESEMARV